METTVKYFNLTIDELLINDEQGYTKEEKLLFDEGLKCTFFDDEEEYRKEAYDFQKWLKSNVMEIKIMLETINGRLAVISI